MSLPKVNVTKGNGNTGKKKKSLDHISAMLITGVAVVGGAQLNTIYKVETLKQVENELLITAAYDTANTVLVWNQISEFFRGLTEDGKLANAYKVKGELYLYIVAQTRTLTNMADITQANSAKTIIDDLTMVKGKIRQLAIIRNPAAGYSPTLSGGLDGDALTAITKAQELADYAFEKNMPCEILVQGRSYNGAASAATDLRTLNKENVSIPIFADRNVGNSNALYNGYSNTGLMLGFVARAKVNEAAWHVAKFRVDDPDSGRMVAAGLSNNLLLSDPSGPDMDLLDDKHFILARVFPNKEGVYLNGSHTAAPDDSDYCTIEYNRVANKVARSIWENFTPELGSNIEVDEETGFLHPAVITYLEGLGENNATTRQMKSDKEVIAIELEIEPEQNVIGTSEINATVDITPYGIVKNFNFDIKLQNPVNA